MSEDVVPYGSGQYPFGPTSRSLYEPIEIVVPDDVEFESADNIVEAPTYKKNPPRRRMRRRPPLEFKGLRIKLAVIRDPDFDPDNNTYIGKPEDIANLMFDVVKAEPLECLWAIPVTSAHQVIGVYEAARGQVNSVALLPIDAIRAVIAVGAQAFVFVHNHPSGKPDMSKDDKLLTRRVAYAAAILGISLLDHIAIGYSGQYYSVQDNEPGLLWADFRKILE